MEYIQYILLPEIRINRLGCTYSEEREEAIEEVHKGSWLQVYSSDSSVFHTTCETGNTREVL